MSTEDADAAGRGFPASPVPRLDARPTHQRREGGRGATGAVDATGPRTPDHDPSRLRAYPGAVADRLIAIAPRIPVRDPDTLRRQFPGLGPEESADRLVAAATRGSATVGAGLGAAAMPRRDTRRLAAHIRRELRRHQTLRDALPPA